MPTPQSATPANDSGEVIGSSLNNSRNEKLWAQTSTTLGTALSSDDPRQSAANVAGSMVTGAASSATQDWLAQFGTARVDLNVDDKFHLDDSSIDFLLPLYDTPSNLFFTQLGYRHKDDRNTVNLGLGYRRFEGNWMYGINSFYDDDVTGGNRRIGIGFEAWTDYLKLSANGYRGLTDWHQSRDFEDYDERPADGFDIRAEGWLPAYPQLGGKIVYEKYYGNNVALIDKDTLKHNPVAVTFGVNYTPIPLLTFGVDHQQGEGGDNDTTFNLELNYRLGEPWSKQIDPAMVDSTRTLAGTRYDLVERNNDIVLDYKKQNLIQLGLPDYQTGNAGETGIITAKINAKYGAERVEWHEESAFFTAGGKAESTGAHGETLKITYPSYINSGSHDMNLYHISAVAYDTRGNKSNNGTTDIQVLKADESTVGIADGDLTVGDNNAVANGTATDSVVAKVTDANSNPVSGVEVTFSAGNGAKVAKETIATGSDGTATTTLTSTTAGAVTVTAKAGESEQNVDVNFTADSDTAEITDANLSVGTGAVADGEQTNAISAIVTDANGNPIANQAVTFSVAEGATITTTQGTTGADGKASATVTSKTAGTYAATASVNGRDVSKNTTFVADDSTAEIADGNLTVGDNNAVANGTATDSVVAKVTDANSNPVSGVEVTFTANNGANVVTETVPTGTDGTATTTLTSTTAGAVTVTAMAGESKQSVDVNFTADSDTAEITDGNLVIGHDNTAASGKITDGVTATATVTDSNGNPVLGQWVTFTVTKGATITTVKGITGTEGRAAAVVTSQKAGTYTVTAEVNGSTASNDAHFVADSDTAEITDANLSVGTGAVADGNQTNAVTAKVTDKNGNPVASQTVTFSVAEGAVITQREVQTGADG
ncbi:inverse autotransporter beta domain-containing protein, partial [Kluyvera intermedia]|uniref:inverse autotransporter beta domain-containing protein n=1 Tax=Kluyvera intermedia TaxID=61648 RepID=UPI003525C0D7